MAGSFDRCGDEAFPVKLRRNVAFLRRRHENVGKKAAADWVVENLAVAIEFSANPVRYLSFAGRRLPARAGPAIQGKEGVRRAGIPVARQGVQPKVIGNKHLGLLFIAKNPGCQGAEIKQPPLCRLSLEADGGGVPGRREFALVEILSHRFFSYLAGGREPGVEAGI